MKRVAILQSNYIPWKGYFDIIHDVDTFIFYDDVQYTTRDWRNRNRIKTAQGMQWLTIPVGSHVHRRVCDVTLPQDGAWAEAHWQRIQAAYRTAPCFELYREYVRDLYEGRSWASLSQLNQALVTGICRDLLGVSTRFESSADYQPAGAKGVRILDLLKQAGADAYVSGPAARSYITDEAFAKAGIQVVWKDYTGYPEYAQVHGAFRHDVTILDLLFHTGPDAPWHIWGWRETAARTAAA